MHAPRVTHWQAVKHILRYLQHTKHFGLAHATCELLWLQTLLLKLEIFLPQSPTLYDDNLGATYLSVDPILHSRIKHIDIDYHFVRGCIKAKSLQVAFLSSKD